MDDARHTCPYRYWVHIRDITQTHHTLLRDALRQAGYELTTDQPLTDQHAAPVHASLFGIDMMTMVSNPGRMDTVINTISQDIARVAWVALGGYHPITVHAEPVAPSSTTRFRETEYKRLNK